MWMCMFIVWYPCEFSRLHNLHPWYWNALLYGLISSGENSAYFLQLMPFTILPFLFHQAAITAGSMEWEVCPTLLHMTSSGNRTLDLLILSPTHFCLCYISVVCWCLCLVSIVYWCLCLVSIVHWCLCYVSIVYWCLCYVCIVYWCLCYVSIVYWCIFMFLLLQINWTPRSTKVPRKVYNLSSQLTDGNTTLGNMLF